jgi:Zn-dependent M28 family amino/carboxypeptidase
MQTGLGPRVPGTRAHDELAARLARGLSAHAPRVERQDFEVPFRGERLCCRNLLGVFPAAGAKRGGPLLLGTHYDTRPQADRDPDPELRGTPIPGANDGGSGTAVLLHMLPWLATRRFDRDVIVAFFDAEDLGNIDGKRFSIGAARMAGQPPGDLRPEQVVVLDMVGGAGMVFDLDWFSLEHPGSRALTSELFGLGASLRRAPFAAEKPGRLKAIESDHYPFLVRRIAAAILLDIDYPQWHTQEDLPEALSAASLGITEEALSLFLSRRQA